MGDLALEDDAEQVTYANGEVAEVRDNPKLAPGEYGVAPTPWSAVQGAAWVTLTKGASGLGASLSVPEIEAHDVELQRPATVIGVTRVVAVAEGDPFDHHRGRLDH